MGDRERLPSSFLKGIANFQGAATGRVFWSRKTRRSQRTHDLGRLLRCGGVERSAWEGDRCRNIRAEAAKSARDSTRHWKLDDLLWASNLPCSVG